MGGGRSKIERELGGRKTGKWEGRWGVGEVGSGRSGRRGKWEEWDAGSRKGGGKWKVERESRGRQKTRRWEGRWGVGGRWEVQGVGGDEKWF